MHTHTHTHTHTHMHTNRPSTITLVLNMYIVYINQSKARQMEALKADSKFRRKKLNFLSRICTCDLRLS